MLSLPRSFSALIALIVLLSMTGCGHENSGGLPTTVIQIGSKNYVLEIAADDPSREHGLMERDTLDHDRGMIFIFDKAAEQSFWMHHTRFPLDILFLDTQGRIVSISTMKEYDESSTLSHGLSKYAIEINAGQAATTGVKPGQKLELPQMVLHTEGK
jgi:uncharacterized membrane protein (UPF0127 family)